MIYSVWDHGTRRYDYYKTPQKSAATSAPRPSHLRGGGVLGIVPERAAWPLPSAARYAGSGKYPKGMIASVESRIGLGQILGLDLTPTNVLVLAALGFMVWRFLVKPAMER